MGSSEPHEVHREHQNRSMEGPESHILSCKTDNARMIVVLLSSLLNGKKDQHGNFGISNDGLACSITSKAKSLQAQCLLSSKLFHVYDYNGEEDGEQFTLNLCSLVECLHIFGPANLHRTSLSMHYYPQGEAFSVILEEQGVLTECDIRCLSPTDDEFQESPVYWKVIVKSEPLRDALADLWDLPGTASLLFGMDPDVGEFRVSADGDLGSCEVVVPRDSSAFVHYSCDFKCEARFPVGSVQQAMKPLTIASETFIRMNQEGMLSIQHMIEGDDGERSFVDVLLCADEGDDSQSDGD